MDPMPHNIILPQSNLICIELSGPLIIQAMNQFHFYIHNMFVLLFLKEQSTCGNKLETVAERKFSIRGIKNKFVLELCT